MDTYRIYDGTDENGIVGTVAPGLFAKEGRAGAWSTRTQWAMERTAYSRWKFTKGWTKVWSGIGTPTNGWGRGVY